MKTGRLDVDRDARQALEVVANGGVAVMPMDVGYSLIASQGKALERIFAAKKRAPTKYNAMLGDMQTCGELFILSAEQRDLIEAIVIDHDLPLGIVAPVNTAHPLLKALDPLAAKRSVYNDTVCMLLNAGPFHAAISAASREQVVPLFGSSANRSMQGTKFRVEDIEPEIIAIADAVIDYGLRKYHPYSASSTLIDLSSMGVLRRGSCCALIEDVAARSFGIALKPVSIQLEPAGG